MNLNTTQLKHLNTSGRESRPDNTDAPTETTPLLADWRRKANSPSPVKALQPQSTPVQAPSTLVDPAYELAVREIRLLLEDEISTEQFESLLREQETQLNFKFTPIQHGCMRQVHAAIGDLQACARNFPSSASGRTAEQTRAVMAK